MPKTIDTMDIPPVCCRCGYVYNPKVDKRVLVFQTKDGSLYIGCEDCLADYGRARWLKRRRVLKEMKFNG